MQASPPSYPARICVQLLDSSHGEAIQSWRFNDQYEISIGRADERDIRVGSVQVSRLHAALRYIEGRWSLTALGRNGVLINGERVEQIPIEDETIFQLGPSGPVLLFRYDRLSNSSVATMDDALTVPNLKVDEEKLAREVAEIVGGDYFQELHAKARKFREQSKTSGK